MVESGGKWEILFIKQKPKFSHPKNKKIKKSVSQTKNKTSPFHIKNFSPVSTILFDATLRLITNKVKKLNCNLLFHLLTFSLF